MELKVLVAYATKYGGTREIAERIGLVIRESNYSVDVIPVDEVPGLGEYGAVVLGSAVYVGQWRKEAAAFLKDNEEDLSKCHVWLFSSGPTGKGDPDELMEGFHFPLSLQPVADRIHPRDIVFFHGILDLKKLGLPEKIVVKGIKAPIGDYRDWDSITSWAQSIVEALKEEAS
jgi:menaquinone-dependent protoporphyrinogen oxidase